VAARNAIASAIADRELTVTRVFDAPRELVFEAWTNPQHLIDWWGPNGFTTTVHEMDVRPGGTWRLTMHGPDGRDYRNRVVFVEVAKPSRLVYKHEPEPGSEPVSFQTTVTFEPEGNQTKVTLRMLFPTAEVREMVVSKYHAEEGAHQTLGRLATHLPGMIVKEIVLTRVFDAPRDLVFRAWTERDRLQRWWGPHGYSNPVCEIDARPGGAIYIEMVGPDGSYPITGEFLEIAAPERLVFTEVVLDSNRDPMFEGLNVVTFEEDNGKTRLTVRVMITRAGVDLTGMDQGWSEMLERLTGEVAR
jgi:uncharacterized protein YndB with AHSA1/START domain